jgi:hypothetical protein
MGSVVLTLVVMVRVFELILLVGMMGLVGLTIIVGMVVVGLCLKG